MKLSFSFLLICFYGFVKAQGNNIESITYKKDKKFTGSLNFTLGVGELLNDIYFSKAVLCL